MDGRLARLCRSVPDSTGLCGRITMNHPPGIARRLSRLGKGGILLLLALVVLTTCGCIRRFYRNRADKEVDEVLAGKDKYPAWAVRDYCVYPPKEARFA